MTAALAAADLAPGDLDRARREVFAALGEDGAAPARRQRVLDFIDTHPDALLRSCATGHLTSSALVVDRSTDRFVLLHHRKADRWFQPGGHADGEGNLAASALREAEEECGITGLAVLAPAIDIDVHEVRPPGEAAHLHLDVRYLVLAPPGAALRGNHESLTITWASVDELERYDPDDGLRRLVGQGLRLVRDIGPAGSGGSA